MIPYKSSFETRAKSSENGEISLRDSFAFKHVSISLGICIGCQSVECFKSVTNFMVTN